ncbi:MAG: LysR family transcriptional regulator [Polyangiaceae bacterium]|jgi:DNA-binding transcriptional LysR family regulator|nr:LysR family transcriptional regulator [Polyangiaceae bacterium]
MNDFDAARLDLNLLRALEALLAEGSVTGAAARLGVGQPAASHALSRLRELFGDPLFVRVGRRMVPTPRAEALRAPLARLLDDARRLVHGSEPFDPRRSARAFGLVCPDVLAPALLRIVARLSRQAPGTRLEVSARREAWASALEEGRADLALMPAPDEGPGLVRRGLGAVHFAVIARCGHPAIARSGALDARGWAAHPHVMVRTGHRGQSIVAGALAGLGFERRVGLVVPTFLAALVAVAETDFFFTAPRELVGPLVRRFDLAVLEPPLALPAVPVAAVWHERHRADEGHRFFRELVRGEIETILREGATPGSP